METKYLFFKFLLTYFPFAFFLILVSLINLASSSITVEPRDGKVNYIPGQSISLRCSSTEYKEFKWYRSRTSIGHVHSHSGTTNNNSNNDVDGHGHDDAHAQHSQQGDDQYEQLMPQDDDVFEIRNERMKIPKPDASFIRNYKCHALNEANKSEVPSEFAIFQVRAQPIILDFDIATSHTKRSGIVTDGDRLEITCEVVKENQGPVEISWLKSRHPDDEQLFDDITSSNDPNDHIKIIKVNDYTKKLLIESVTLSDRAYYMCVANNKVTNVASKTIFIRVKDKLIALWPFVGIVSELALLFSIIFIYEHQRAATERET